MDIRLLENDTDGQMWNEWLENIHGSSVYHRWEWRRVYEKAYGFRPRYWTSYEGNKITGVFPAVLMRTLKMRRCFISLPFIQAAGPLHESQSLLGEFTEAVISQERSTGTRNFQLRASGDLAAQNFSSLDSYVTMVLDISEGSDKVWEKNLHTQKRSQVRKARKNGLVSITGKHELLDDFYRVWTQRINRLGTPVFSRRFFSEILHAFGDDVWIQAVQAEGKTVAAMLLLKHQTQSFDPWAATMTEYNRVGANGLLYWSAIEEAERRGCQSFDMGRSERDGGTYKFKSEWGANPRALRYLYEPSASDNMSAAQKYQSLIKLWQLQPMCLANLTGPFVTRFLTDL